MEQEVQYSDKKLKPRGIILLANTKDLEKVKDYIKTLSDIRLIYVTTAPCSTSLRVIREPNSRQPFEQALFTLGTDAEL